MFFPFFFLSCQTFRGFSLLFRNDASVAGYNSEIRIPIIYHITTATLQSPAGVAENYAFTSVGGKLTIEKAYQTLTWEQELSPIIEWGSKACRYLE